MNNVTFYFRETITSKEYAWQTLEKLFLVASEKYIQCSREFRRFHMSGSKINSNQEFLQRIDIQLASNVYVVIRSFFKYLVCNIREGTVFKKEDYHEFFTFSLKFFEIKFKTYRSEFPDVHKILVAR